VRCGYSMRYFLFIAVIATGRLASAQLISVGAIGGVPTPNTSGTNNESPLYTVGGSVEFHLPAGFSLEADALYRRLGDTSIGEFISGTAFASYTERRRGNAWQFPLLGKYYFRRTSAWQPFLGTGFAFETIGVHDVTNGLTNPFAATTGSVVNNYRAPLEVGAVFAGGVRFHVGRISILPQVRYTRWGGINVLTRNNETSFLLGAAF
jgi:hypothetical protein